MTILDYDKTRKKQLADMMIAYMTELNCGIPEDIIRGKLSDLIDRMWEGNIIRISLPVDNGTPMGFSVYQIDTPESDWCKRPGWGFIREYYVDPAYRKQGIGRLLAADTERRLRKMGAERLYLTSGPAVPFWQRCGWQLTDELCSNGQYILEKYPYLFDAIGPSHELWNAAKDYAAACSWRAGKALAASMESGAFSDWERVIIARQNGKICGYCTVSKTDCIPGLPYSPFIGYVFVEEGHRGSRLSQRLIGHASDYLRTQGFDRVYLVSDHENLYEKYEFSVIDRKTAPWGAEEKIYAKEI